MNLIAFVSGTDKEKQITEIQKFCFKRHATFHIFQDADEREQSHGQSLSFAIDVACRLADGLVVFDADGSTIKHRELLLAGERLQKLRK